LRADPKGHDFGGEQEVFEFRRGEFAVILEDERKRSGLEVFVDEVGSDVRPLFPCNGVSERATRAAVEGADRVSAGAGLDVTREGDEIDGVRDIGVRELVVHKTREALAVDFGANPDILTYTS